MVRISEKRSVRIPPVKIDGELLASVGEILKKECPENSVVSIGLYADSRDIETEDSKEFEKMDIPPDTYGIAITATTASSDAGGAVIDEEMWENPIEIEIDVRKPKDSQIRVRGEKSTWVVGVSDSLAKAFDKKKLGYGPIAKFGLLRAIMAISSAGFLTYVGGFAFSRLGLEPLYSLMFVMVFLYLMTLLLKQFFDWVFPYFEINSDDFLPRKIRKWALVILWGSGIIPTILLRLLGF